MLPDNPFEELSKLISSAHSSGEDEGPAFQYPEVINDPYNDSLRSLSESKYRENIEHHINGLKNTYNSNPRIIEKESDYKRPIKKTYQNTKSYKSKSSTQRYNEHGNGKVFSFGKSQSTIPFSYVKTDDYREPSVLEQLARNHISGGGHPIRLSNTGSVSADQKPSSFEEPEDYPDVVRS